MLFSWASDTPLLLFGPLLPLSFLLSQDDINEAADETEREGHPGQHVGVAELHPRHLLRTHHGVDDGRAHHKHACGKIRWVRSGERDRLLPESRWGILTGQDLEDGREEEAPALDQPEQLVQEGNEGEEAEEHRQDHQGLNCLDPVWETNTEQEFRRRIAGNTRLVALTLPNLHCWPVCSGSRRLLSGICTTDLCSFRHLQSRSGKHNNTVLS